VVCHSVTLVSLAEMAEPIEVPFGLRTWVGPGNHVLDGGPDDPCRGAVFTGKDMPGHARRHSTVSCATSGQSNLT